MDANTVYWTHLSIDSWSIYLAATEEGICYVGSQNAPFTELVNWENKQLPTFTLLEDELVMKPYVSELTDYFEGKRSSFTLPMKLYGTVFQQAVWKALEEFPYGQIVTYTDLARKLGKEKAVRAVGTAIGANPVLILIPCHRVIGKNGKLAGYRGGLTMKEKLLQLEQASLPQRTRVVF